MEKIPCQKHLQSTATKSLEKIPWRLALIDDDSDFRQLMGLVISPLDIQMETFASLSALSSTKALATFDAIIIDYYLENTTGVKLAQYMNSFFPNVPVVLISGRRLAWKDIELPPCIKAFLPKDLGPYEIVYETMNLILDRGPRSTI